MTSSTASPQEYSPNDTTTTLVFDEMAVLTPPQTSTEEPSTAPQNTHKQIIDSMLRALITEADMLQTKATNAKTSIKRKYYTKKVVKIRKDVINMIQYRKYRFPETSTTI